MQLYVCGSPDLGSGSYSALIKDDVEDAICWIVLRSVDSTGQCAVLRFGVKRYTSLSVEQKTGVYRREDGNGKLERCFQHRRTGRSVLGKHSYGIREPGVGFPWSSLCWVLPEKSIYSRPSGEGGWRRGSVNLWGISTVQLTVPMEMFMELTR